MLNRMVFAGSMSAALIALWGCEDGSLSLHYHDDDPRPVIVERTYVPAHSHHVCSHGCHDHYWNGTRLVVIGERHHHGPGCGHEWDGKFWISLGKSRALHDHRDAVRVHPGQVRVTSSQPREFEVAEDDHVHGPSCGCAWSRRGSKWIRVNTGHVHGRNCGHFFLHGKWCISD